MSVLKVRHCIVIWAVLGVGLIVPLSGKIEDPDLWWHITTGRLIVQSHTIPTHDPFSYTAAGKEWIPHEWLSEIAFYGVYHRFGLAGIVWLRSLLVFLFTWSLYALVKRRIGDPVISAVVAVVLSLATWCFWTERPQLFSYVLLVTLLRLVDRWKPCPELVLSTAEGLSRKAREGVRSVLCVSSREPANSPPTSTAAAGTVGRT